jgi:hypothetical protein
MSQDGKDNDKNFLSRWSQRKREVKLPDADSAPIKPDDETEALPTLAAESDAEETFDLSSLPKLEDITETTDIKAFLRKGVPESLRNAALRKSWALDSSIRNYVNPALDYAYDWNTPGGVPGNSELAAGTDIAKMVRQIIGSDRATPDPEESNGPPHDEARGAASDDIGIDAVQNPQPDLPLQVRLSLPTDVSTPVSAEYEPSDHVQVEDRQDAELSESDAPQQEVRRHGSAKPRI